MSFHVFSTFRKLTVGVLIGISAFVTTAYGQNTTKGEKGLKIGDVAPDFELKGTDGQNVQTVRLQRKVGRGGRLVSQSSYRRMNTRMHVAP